jgi:uncharacterized protein involved in outer membrane biogenesis
MTEKKPSWKPNRLQKVAIATVVAVIVYTLGGFFLLPPLVKSLAEKKLSQALERQTTITRVKINPYLLTCAIDGFTIKNQAGKEAWISCNHLFVNLQAVSLFKLAVVCKDIQLTDPYVKITRNEDLSYNFSDLLPAAEKAAPEQKKPLRFSLNNIQISDGKIDFTDTPRKTKHHITEINLGLPLISNLPYHLETKVQPAFSAKVNGTLVQLSGATKPFSKSLETSFKINIDQLNLPFYLAYLPGERNFTVTDGTLDTRLTLAYAHPAKESAYLKLSGSLKVENLAVSDNTSRRFLALPQLQISFNPTNLLAGQVHIASLAITKPQVEIERQADGSLRLPELTLPEEQKKESPRSQQKQTNFSLTIDQLSLNDGQLTFLDQATKPPFTTRITPINLTISNFSTKPEQQGGFTGSLRSATGESVDVKGDFFLKPMRLSGHFGINDITLSVYFPYYRDYFSGIIEQGSLSGAGDFTLVPAAADKTMRLEHLSAELKNLKIRKDNIDKPLIDLPTFTIRETSIDLLNRQVVIGKLESTAGIINLMRQQDGRINLQDLLPPSATIPQTEKKTETDEPEPDNFSPWQVDLNSGTIDNYQLQFVDKIPSHPVTIKLEHTTLALERLTTIKNQLGKIKLSFRLNKNGRFNVGGKLGLIPLAANLTYKADQIALQPFQSYLNDFFAMDITRGLAGSSGSLQLSINDQKKPKITYQGRLAISNFASVDALKSDDFLSWKSLIILGIKGNSQPLSLTIDEIALYDPRTSFVVVPDGTLNLQAMVKTASGEEVSTKTAETNRIDTEQPALALRINRIKVKNGRFNFLDRSLSPSYAMSVDQLNGSVDHLSSSRSQPARANFNAKLNGHAPIAITGTINPLPKEDMLADLTVTFNDVDLSPFTPYSGKFVGHTISKGKITLAIHCLIDKTKLSAENHLFLDQFTFGDSVDNPDAVNLPVKLAVALLKNRQGEIKLDLPVRGDLADPHFNLGGIIFKMIFNIINKTVTSPFALLGSMFGGGEDVNHITFDPGSILITPENQKKLAAVGKALHERPGLKLDIQGQADPETDSQGLKDYRFQHLLKAHKLKKFLRKSTTDIVSLDKVTIEAAEYEKYLTKAYKAAPFKKAKNTIGLVKKLPPEDMKRLLYEHMAVTDGDLRLLAYQRAEQVKDYLVANGPVETERIFLTEPEIPGITAEKTTPPARKVTLIIK